MTIAPCLCRLLVCSGPLTTLWRGLPTALTIVTCPLLESWGCAAQGACPGGSDGIQWCRSWCACPQAACSRRAVSTQPAAGLSPGSASAAGRAKVRTASWSCYSPQLGPQHADWLPEITLLPWLPICRVVQAQYAQERPSSWPQPAAAVRALQQTAQDLPTDT